MTDPQDNHEISKSQRKRDALDLQKLGEALVDLETNRLDKLALPADLTQAIQDARKIRSHGARKRQLRYIGKLLRQHDHAAIQQALLSLHQPHREQVKFMHSAEHWRDRLIAEGDNALGHFISAYPLADRQKLRQLLRQAGREVEAGKPPRSARELYRTILALVSPEN